MVQFHKTVHKQVISSSMKREPNRRKPAMTDAISKVLLWDNFPQ